MALRVVSGSYDITDDIEGLGWSSVSPGGDETCTFTLKRDWFANSPEIERGSLLRVMEGIEVLWQGRVEDADRSGDSTEQIGVTAYGLGARVKDATMREIYIDRDLGNWTELSAEWRLHFNIPYTGFSVVPDADTGGPCLLLAVNGSWASGSNPFGGSPHAGAMYDAGEGIELACMYYDVKFRVPGESDSTTNWILQPSSSTEDSFVTGWVGGADIATGPTAVVGFFTPDEPRRIFSWEFCFNSAPGGTDGAEYRAALRDLAVIANHGLALQGEAPNYGFLVSQMIVNAVERASGIAVRRIDPTSFVCEQAAFRDRVKVEDAVVALNKPEAHHRTWGTWGPDSPLDNSTDGYFDYRSIDTDPTWIAYRSECENCNLHSETATLFDVVHVNYTEAGSGVQRTVTRTSDVPELNGIPREETIDGGTLTQGGAETLGDAVLALSGGFAPARGNVVVAQPIRHVDRGLLPAHYARADGAAFRVPDVLPSSSLFALDSTPDRRTTFPIKRVAVDAGNKATPVTTIEVDQTSEAISALQARLAQSAEVRGG